jgi:hypothetical protein
MRGSCKLCPFERGEWLKIIFENALTEKRKNIIDNTFTCIK